MQLETPSDTTTEDSQEDVVSNVAQPEQPEKLSTGQRLWGKNKVIRREDVIKAERGLVANFPSCKQPIRRALACAYHHQLDPTDSCERLNNELNFCLISSYCPKEAAAMRKCLGGEPINMSQTHLPVKCLVEWRSLDNCMISHQVPD